MEAVRQTGTRLRGLSETEVVRLVLALLLLWGFALRARGYLLGTIPLWEDEAAWAMRLVDLPLTEHAIRPLGFMAVSKLLAWLLSPSETVLRAVPWLAGVGALAMAPPLANRLFSSAAARLLFVAVVALHPAAIDLSKEFKPYSLSVALHMAFLLLGLRYLAAGKLRDLAPLLALLFLGTLLSQDALFAYPGVFGLLFVQAFRGRHFRHVAWVALTAMATVALIVGLYVCIWSKALKAGDATTDYWGKKYDVFYLKPAAAGESRLAWTTARVGDMAALPGVRRENWHGRRLSQRALSDLRAVDTSVWQALCVLGLAVVLCRRKPREALLLVSPLAVMVAFNALGFWPLGAFRTNLFVLVYGAAIAAFAVDRRSSQPNGWALLPAGVLVVAPFLLLGSASHATKSSMAANSAFTDGMRALISLHQGRGSSKALLALDNPSCAPWRYYTGYHPDKARAAEMLATFHARCTKGVKDMARVLRKGLPTAESRAFILVSRARSINEVETNLPADLIVDGRTYVGENDQLVLRVRKNR